MGTGFGSIFNRAVQIQSITNGLELINALMPLDVFGVGIISLFTVNDTLNKLGKKFDRISFICSELFSKLATLLRLNISSFYI